MVLIKFVPLHRASYKKVSWVERSPTLEPKIINIKLSEYHYAALIYHVIKINTCSEQKITDNSNNHLNIINCVFPHLQ